MKENLFYTIFLCYFFYIVAVQIYACIIVPHQLSHTFCILCCCSVIDAITNVLFLFLVISILVSTQKIFQYGKKMVIAGYVQAIRCMFLNFPLNLLQRFVHQCSSMRIRVSLSSTIALDSNLFCLL